MNTMGDTLKDPAFLISIWVTGQFFVLVVLFGMKLVTLDVEIRDSIIQAYLVAFTAIWGYWIGSSVGSKKKDAVLAALQSGKGAPEAKP